MLNGVDVSNHQQNVDWQAVAASGRAFAFVKATEGKTYTDPYLAQNWPTMQAAGLVRGMYHFARPSLNTPEEEAAHFVSVMANVGGLAAGDLLVLDLEDTDVAANKDLRPWVMAWLATVKDATGCRAGIYTGKWYTERYALDLTAVGAAFLWLAAYGDVWPKGADIWQYSDTGRVGGVAGNCDLNRYDGTADDLRAMGKPPASDYDRASAWQTVIDVVNGWSNQLAQASHELASVKEVLEKLRP